MLVADVLLVGWAVKRQSDPAPHSSIVSTTTSSQSDSSGLGSDHPSDSSSASPSASQSGASTGSTSGSESSDAGAQVLLSGSGLTVLKATRGTCADGGGEVERSTDSGKTFEPVRLPAAAVEVDKVDAQTMTIVASDQKCSPTTYASTDGGRTWRSQGGDAEWHLAGDPTASQVVSPKGPVATPCPPVSLSVVRNDIVRVLCGDGRIFRAPDDVNWQQVGAVPGATAIRFPTPYQGFALAPGSKGCRTALMVSTNSGATWREHGCLEGSPGRALASSASGGLLALVGDRLQVSTDNGASWRAP